jgi:Protein phosphatase 2C
MDLQNENDRRTLQRHQSQHQHFVPSSKTFPAAPTVATAVPSSSSSLSSRNLPTTTTTTTSTTTHVLPPTIDEYQMALRQGLKKCDNDILKINHWSFQGSTALCCWIHEQEPEDMSMDTTSTFNDETIRTTSTTSSSSSTSDYNTDGNQQSTSTTQKTLIIANVGDSRAVLSRNRIAYEITRDHKPNDPIEKRLRRGSYDNITVLILWLDETMQPKQQSSSASSTASKKDDNVITAAAAATSSTTLNDEMPFP